LFLGLAAFFYPFRAFQFLSHFKFFMPVRIFINTLYRMTPGIIIFTIVVAMTLLGWSQGLFLVFSPYIYEYRTIVDTLNTLSYGLMNQKPEFIKFTENNRDLEYLGITGLLINYCHLILLIIFVALSSFLFRKAAAFERDSAILTPDKEWLNKEIKQIKDQVNQIYMVKVKGTDNKEAEVQFKNTQIVAWLLNRSQTSLKEEREAFFGRVNEEMKQMTGVFVPGTAGNEHSQMVPQNPQETMMIRTGDSRTF
jgi:hypothetical protein